MPLVEAPAEVPGGRRIGDPLGAERVEEDLVVAAELDVLKTGAIHDAVVGDVQNVVGFVVGQMELQDIEVLVDGLGQPELLRHLVDEPDTAVGEPVSALGDLVADVAGSEHRVVLGCPFAFAKAMQNPSSGILHSLLADPRVLCSLLITRNSFSS